MDQDTKAVIIDWSLAAIIAALIIVLGVTLGRYFVN